MNKIFLPLVNLNFKFNQQISHFIKDDISCKAFDFTLSGFTGSFPFNCWNGSINNNMEPLLVYDNFEQLIRQTNIPIMLDCSNTFLKDTDFTDVQSNVLLNLLYRTGGTIEVSLLELKQYIEHKYPETEFVISDKINLLRTLTANEINILLEQPNIKYLIINDNLTDISILKDIKLKHKIIINICSSCSNCSYYKDCLIKEQQSQINYSEYSTMQSCPNRNILNTTNIVSTINKFNKLGVFNFKIEEPKLKDVKSFNIRISEALIKPEYLQSFYKMMLTD